jgi:amino acid transporter
MGKWSLAALALNTVIGSGIFGLPSPLAGLLGTFSPLAVLGVGTAMLVIVACLSEVASYFTAAGGPYLYARVAFGRFTGIQMGWMFWLFRLAASAANANLFALYLGVFWPQSQNPLPRFLILTTLVWGLAAINFCGVHGGARVSSVLTIAKLLPLFGICIAGVFFLVAHPHSSGVLPHGPAPNLSNWLKSGLLLAFSYGGFESALAPTSEARDPRRDAAFALFTALGVCIVLYTLLQWVAVGTVADLAHSQRPLADVARRVLGPVGATIIAIGALISTFGNVSGNALIVPRITFALAEQGDFPKLFAAIHPRFRTPYVSILAFAFLNWALALGGSFTWNVALSAVARLLVYGTGCAALRVLRKKMLDRRVFRMPGGPWLAVLGVILCCVLLTQIDHTGSLILLATIAVAALNWFVVRNRPAPTVL